MWKEITYHLLWKILPLYLQPVLSDVLYLLAGSTGFIVHYIIPQARKEMPWLCCSHPLLRSNEWMHFEVKGTALFLSQHFIFTYVFNILVGYTMETPAAIALLL